MSVIDGKLSSSPLAQSPNNLTFTPGTHFSSSSAASVNGLTKAMILHPIACALAFIAFALSCGAGVVGSVLGASVAAVAWMLTLVVMAIDFSIFGVSYCLIPLALLPPLSSVASSFSSSLSPSPVALLPFSPLPSPANHP